MYTAEDGDLVRRRRVADRGLEAAWQVVPAVRQRMVNRDHEARSSGHAVLRV